MNGKQANLTLDELEALLAAFGSEASRWPAARRPAMEALLASESAARRVLAEARALDCVLDRASRPDPSRVGLLADRIMAKALAAEPEARERMAAVVSPAPRPEGASIVSLGERRTTPALRQATPVMRVRSGGPWRAAGALAASLVLGIMIGTTDLASTAAESLAAVAGFQGGDADVVLTSLQGDAITNVLDEDQI